MCKFFVLIKYRNRQYYLLFIILLFSQCQHLHRHSVHSKLFKIAAIKKMAKGTICTEKTDKNCIEKGGGHFWEDEKQFGSVTYLLGSVGIPETHNFLCGLARATD